jgi:hypothetical protein
MARRTTSRATRQGAARQSAARGRSSAATARAGARTAAARGVGGTGRGAGLRTRQKRGTGKARAASTKQTVAARKPTTGPARNSTGGAPGPGRARRETARFDDVTAAVQRQRDAGEADVPTPPSSLDLDRHASAARTGRQVLNERLRKHTAVSPEISAGDVDADWMGGYFVGDEAATGDNPTPGQGAVEDVGHAAGVDYEDAEELRTSEKLTERDRKRWELDPASSEDYPRRNRRQ